jgi:hypothetical protein
MSLDAAECNRSKKTRIFLLEKRCHSTLADNRFLISKLNQSTKKMATQLLKDGRAHVTAS